MDSASFLRLSEKIFDFKLQPPTEQEEEKAEAKEQPQQPSSYSSHYRRQFERSCLCNNNQTKYHHFTNQMPNERRKFLDDLLFNDKIGFAVQVENNNCENVKMSIENGDINDDSEGIVLINGEEIMIDITNYDNGDDNNCNGANIDVVGYDNDQCYDHYGSSTSKSSLIKKQNKQKKYQYLNIICPEDGCHLLLDTEYRLNSHLIQDHYIMPHVCHVCNDHFDDK